MDDVTLNCPTTVWYDAFDIVLNPSVCEAYPAAVVCCPSACDTSATAVVLFPSACE